MWDWLKRAVVRKVIKSSVDKNLRAAEKNLRAAEAKYHAVNKPGHGVLLRGGFFWLARQ